MKIRLRSIEELEKKISFATFIRSERQIDTYFKMPDRKLLRIREVEGRYFLGYKEIIDRENTLFREIEVEVGEKVGLLAILKKLGFEELVVVRKTRKIYRYGDITIELNEVEGAGCFADFEIISTEKHRKRDLIRFIKTLGYTEENIEPRLYTELVTS